MRSTGRYQAIRVIGITLWIWGCLCAQSRAEIRMDGTLGPAGALQGPDYQIGADLGRQAGGNLFHSFEILRIDTGESATFSGPATVATVIGRVTGGVSSVIDGNLACTIDAADVYLINPAGVVFGENAALEMTGDFHVSTADYLRLGDQGRFDASLPENSILTTAPPEAFGFLDGDVADITVTGAQGGLQVAGDATLSIVGGDVTLDNAGIYAPGGRINMAAVASAGELSIGDMNTDFFQEMGHVAITGSVVCASGYGAGEVYVRGGQLVVDNGHVEAETWGASDGGVIDLDIRADARFTHKSGIWGSTYGTGRGADVMLNVNDLSLADDSAIKLFCLGSGDGGVLRITSGNSVELSNGGNIYALAVSEGDAWDIQIRADEAVNITGFSPTEQTASGINSSTTGNGDAGEINITTGNCVISQGAGLHTMTSGGGNAGDIIIAGADAVEISDDSVISTGTLGLGNGGEITLDAPCIDISGSVLSSSYGVGDAGKIDINAGTLEMQGESMIDASTWGVGSGGEIEIATDRLIMSVGVISAGICYGCFSGDDSAAIPAVLPPAGDIRITANELVYLSSINISEPDARYSHISSIAFGMGSGGSIHIETPELILENGAWVLAANWGNGDAGDIVINAGSRIALTHWAQINTEADSGHGGNITLVARDMLYLEDSDISTSVGGGEGSGGDIQIDPRFVILNNATITAQAYQGNGGNIDIVTQHFIQDTVSIVDASSQLGIDGDVDIASPDIDFSDISTLSTDFVTTEDLNTQRCSARDVGDSSSLIVKGKGGLLPGPEKYLTTLVSDLKERGMAATPQK